jgi:hypothetical protein
VQEFGIEFVVHQFVKEERKLGKNKKEKKRK